MNFLRQSHSEPKPPLDPEDAQRILTDSENPEANTWCKHCGFFHFTACPRVRSLEWRGGEIIRVEFWQDWDRSECYSPQEVAEAADTERGGTT
jgi:hypothetical protein